MGGAGRRGNLASFNDICLRAAVCTSHFSLQMAKVQSTNHTRVLISAPNVFLTAVGIGL
jgi:hypothetical protein